MSLSPPAGSTTPQGVLLEWTEQAVGDYDENGLVTVSDLTPLANPNFWQRALTYVDPRGQGVKWPSPDGAAPALLYDPIWRLARVDGEANGLITLGDISPIAKHFGEGLSGYRVYCRAVGDPDFVQVDGTIFASINPAPAGDLSIPREATAAPTGVAPDPFYGVHYDFFDQSLPGPGDYEYMVAPYDIASSSEGVQSFSFIVTYPANPGEVTDPTPPSVTLTTLGPGSGDAPLGTFFQAQIASPDRQVEAVFWDFDSDGKIDAATGRHPTAQYTYATAGHYKATVYVVLPGGVNTSAELDVDVLSNGNSLPVAALTATPSSGSAPLSVTLDATASKDLEGISSFEFDPQGTGTFVSNGQSPTLQALYPQGEYDAVVRITDTSGATSTATAHVSVGPIDSQPPTVSISSDLVGGEFAPQNVNFTFDVNDPENGQSTLDVDYEDDGVWDDTVAVSNGQTTLSHTYPDFGTYTVRARVTDDHGLTGEGTYAVTLLENHSPVAQLTSDVDTGPAPLTVSFDASGSSDPDGQPLQYFWDFTGTGNFIGPLTATEVHTYYQYAVRGAWVRVVDSKGASAEAAVAITTTTGWQLQYVLGPADTPFSTEVSMATVDGRPAFVFVRSGILNFIRSDNTQGTSWTTAAQLDAPTFGVMQPTLKVINGVPAVGYLSGAGDVKYVSALDADGASWNAPVVVTTTVGAGAATDLETVDGNPALAWVDSLGHLSYARASDPSGSVWNVPVDLGAHGSFKYDEEIDLDVVAGNPTIVAGDGTSILYHRAADTDGLVWLPGQTVYTGPGVKQSAAMTVVSGLPFGLPTVLYYDQTGQWATRPADETGSSWSPPVLISNVDITGYTSTAPEVEVEPIGGALTTLSVDYGIFASLDAFGNTWTPRQGIFDIVPDPHLLSYDLTDAGGKPVLSIENSQGLAICTMH